MSLSAQTDAPFNVAGARENAGMLAKRFPWITPPAGAFAGADQPAGGAGGPPGAGDIFTKIFGHSMADYMKLWGTAFPNMKIEDSPLFTGLPGAAGTQPLPPGAPPAPVIPGATNPVVTANTQPNSVQAILAALAG